MDATLALLIALVALQALALWLLWQRRSADNGETPRAIDTLRTDLAAANERSERSLRADIADSARGTRSELMQTLATFQEAVVKQAAEATRTQ
ncbi:MAG: hypothetical protein RL014_1222, partial [Pseudomonadota bacterium]